jgi:hypothetical protein
VGGGRKKTPGSSKLQLLLAVFFFSFRLHI